MVRISLGSGYSIKFVGIENLFTIKEIFMKVHGLITNQMVMESTRRQMGRDLKETGKIIANMVSVLSFLLVARDMRASTTWDLKKVLGLTSTRMAKSIKETGKQIRWKD